MQIYRLAKLTEKSYEIWSNPTCMKKGEVLIFVVLHFLKSTTSQCLCEAGFTSTVGVDYKLA